MTGRGLAERWCASCHIIDRTPAAATANGLPSFPAIAAKAATTKQSWTSFCPRSTPITACGSGSTTPT